MPDKIVYLFGAGATHAELSNAYPADANTEKFEIEKGLLMRHVSLRVIQRAYDDAEYIRGISGIISKTGANIEQLISLLESIRIEDSYKKANTLRRLIEEDISQHLIFPRDGNYPILYKSLLEFHQQDLVKQKEELFGLITLNYDDLLDNAYKQIFQTDCIPYCRSQNETRDIPLLKLHGSFGWKHKIGTIESNTPIIPPGIRKNYLEIPFNYIWGKAFELLVQCNKLRVIGCSLEQTDWGLIELLFKVHIWRKEPFEIEIISSEHTGIRIKKNYGFFPKITTLTKLENNLIPDQQPDNIFKEWIVAKANRLLKNQENIQRTIYLKQLCGFD